MHYTGKGDKQTLSNAALIQSSLDAIDEGIAIFDANLILVFASRKFFELRDIPETLGEVGTQFEEHVRFRAERGDYGPGDVESFVRERVELVKKAKTYRIERTRRDGMVLEIRGNALPGGGFIATYTDITDRKRAEEALQARNADLESAKMTYEEQGATIVAIAEELDLARKQLDAVNRAKSGFITNMSHELRTPLNAIIGFSDMIQGQTFGPVGNPKYLEYINDINACGTHLLGLINDILDMSKIEAGKTDLHETNIDVSRILGSCIALVKEQAETGGVKIECDTASSLPALYADERILKQILINLLSNAIKFTPRGGKVTMRTWSHRDDGFVFQVSDTGIGIALEDIPKALAPYSQIDSDLGRKYKGTGLGLPLTKSFAELHGGSLNLQSKVGVGTTVTVRFPASRNSLDRL